MFNINIYSMKKILFAAPLLSLFFFACDPSVDEIGMDSNITAEELTSGFTISAKSTGNNNLTFITSPNRYIKVYDASSDECIAMGTLPTYQAVPPARTLNLYAVTMNQDGTTTKSSTKSIDVSEFTDLPEIFNNIFGDGNGGFTTNTWVWDDTADDGVWGNGGYLENTGPGWWVVQIDGIDEQANDKSLPNDGKDGWMKMSLTGVEMSRGDKGTVKVNEDIVKAGWDIGTINFSGTFPLLGIQPNAGGNQYEYHILKADGERLRLCAPEPGAGDWGTAWFWNFKKQ